MKYRILILLIIGCLQDLAPDYAIASFDEFTECVFDLIELVDTLFTITIDSLTNYMVFLLINFCRGFQIIIDISLGLIDDIVLSICSGEMMHYYHCNAYIFKNISEFINGNLYIWFLFFVNRPRYEHNA